ncbi:hypothetical protein [Lysobacter gummosus]|uniref:hypothetical protein n=1 Tax=Lysobacter gummosus TaxID=262324 RepID=UPI003624B3BA
MGAQACAGAAQRRSAGARTVGVAPPAAGLRSGVTSPAAQCAHAGAALDRVIRRRHRSVRCAWKAVRKPC